MRQRIKYHCCLVTNTSISKQNQKRGTYKNMHRLVSFNGNLDKKKIFCCFSTKIKVIKTKKFIQIWTI